MTLNTLVGTGLWESGGGRTCLEAEGDFTEEIVTLESLGMRRKPEGRIKQIHSFL